jgi:butyryl-CoA dehydrogenase
MKQIKDKVVVITGAGSGIGRALAQDFAKRGAKLALNDFKEDTLLETIASLAPSTPVFYSIFDVSSEEKMEAFAKDVHQEYNRVDIVINNAGVAQEGLMASEISTEDYKWLLGINMWGPIYGSKAFLPYLRQQKESSLVNISSVFGLVGIPAVSSYCVSKFAVRGFTESVLLEERINKTGVAVSCVHPGGIKTNIAKSAKGGENGKLAEFDKALRTPPKSAAKVIIKGIQKKKSRILIGPDAYLIYYLNKFGRGLLQNGILYNYNKMKENVNLVLIFS